MAILRRNFGPAAASSVASAAAQQQRIPLKGRDDSIDLFTDLLRSAKEREGSKTSAEVILEAARCWRDRGSSSSACKLADPARLTACPSPPSRPFYLQLLTRPECQAALTAELELLRSDHPLRVALRDSGLVPRSEFLLEALIVVLRMRIEEKSAESAISEVEKARPPPQPRPPRPYRDRCDIPASPQINGPEANCQNEAPLSQMITTAAATAGGGGSRHHQNAVSATRVRGDSEPPKRDSFDSSGERHLSWRQRLRRQQLEENQRLCQMVRQSRRSTTPQLETSDDKRIAVTTVLAQRNDGFVCQPAWEPVHQEAIRQQQQQVHLLAAGVAGNKENSPLGSPARNWNRSRFATAEAMSHQQQQRQQEQQQHPTPPHERSNSLRLKYDLGDPSIPVLSIRERREAAESLSREYLTVFPPEARPVPGMDSSSCAMNAAERARAGADCDEVFPGVLLGNGATARNLAHLRRAGVTHVLNAAEFRGVNVDGSYFGSQVRYMGLKVEDTPQTQICRHFLDVAEFIDDALTSGSDNVVLVNCVFGRSRSTTCVVAFLMLAKDWEAANALRHIRARRPVHVNPGFLQQLADLDHKLNWLRKEKKKTEAL